jgi:hypothetical protein
MKIYDLADLEFVLGHRDFLIGAAGTAAGLFAPDTSRAQCDVGPRLAVAYDDPGQAIASDFIGLSYESAPSPAVITSHRTTPPRLG